MKLAAGSMSAALLRQALGRAARSLGVRAESTAAAAAERAVPAAVQQQLAEAMGHLPTSDPALQPYYEQLANMEVLPSHSPRKASESEIAVRAAAGRWRRRVGGTRALCLGGLACR